MNSDDFIVKGKYQETRTIRRKCNNKKKTAKEEVFFSLFVCYEKISCRDSKGVLSSQQWNVLYP